MAALTQRLATPLFRQGFASSLFGAVGLFVGFVLEPTRTLFSYLVAYCYVLSLAVGVLFLLMMGYVSNARWMSVIRRVLDTAALSILPLSLLFAPLAWGTKHLYVWAQHRDARHGGELVRTLAHKAAYLNEPFFLGRSGSYLLVWVVAALALRTWSMRKPPPDPRVDPEVALSRERRFSAWMLVLSSVAVTFAAFDWLMSLDPTWFSSIFGIYYFAGALLGGIAVATLAAYAGFRSGSLALVLTPHHFHALGRLLLGFTVFWAYVAYFQVFLIAMADRPNEVTFYLARMQGSFRPFVLVLALGHFALPFLLLLPRSLKFRHGYVAALSAWLLIMHFVDVYWLVMPSLTPQRFTPHWLDLAALLTVAGVTAAFCGFVHGGRDLVARNDPFLSEGVHYASNT